MLTNFTFRLNSAFAACTPAFAACAPSDGSTDKTFRLLTPSSAARALAAGAPNIERVDKLVQTIAAGKGKRLAAIDESRLKLA